MALRWKNGAAWEGIPTAALAATYGGTYHIEYPRPQAIDGAGYPCAAIGKPYIVIQTPKMTGTGMAFWRTKFTSAGVPYTDFSLEVLNVYTGTVDMFAGRLWRPTFASQGTGATVATTVYRDVRIEITDLVETA